MHRFGKGVGAVTPRLAPACDVGDVISLMVNRRSCSVKSMQGDCLRSFHVPSSSPAADPREDTMRKLVRDQFTSDRCVCEFQIVLSAYSRDVAPLSAVSRRPDPERLPASGHLHGAGIHGRRSSGYGRDCDDSGVGRCDAGALDMLLEW